MVNMSCSADAVPSAMYTFLMDGVVQQPEGSSTFLIQPASRDNDGSYQCSARNNAGTKTSESRTLVVHYKPECHHPDYMYADLGEDFTVASNCSANPTDMNYQWSSVPNVTDLDNDPATFTFLVSTKVGTNYTVTVIANNSIGSTTESVIVIVA
ncbi:B-cell receptor CD22-like, partial [Anneissia japonica]|uniref:B-cell receptor CD22-like n=1 Tax=Anneissia japonica TaxID=1529436 RepID=UPI001425625A